MFSGIIQGVGRVGRVAEGPGGGRFVELELPRGLPRLAAGSSLAVDGVCLTLERLRGRRAEFFVSPRTLSLTTLGALRRGTRVNIEPSLRWGDPLDGHLVQGHVEGRARLLRRDRRGRSLELTFSFPPKLARALVPQGSAALAGVSLTVASKRGPRARFALIPETLRRTTLGGLTVGADVNVETDLLSWK